MTANKTNNKTRCQTKAFPTWCPLFPGFDNTPYELCLPENPENPATNFPNQIAHIGKTICTWMETTWTTHPKLKPFGITKIKFQKVTMPKDYTHTNNEIHCEIQMDPKKFSKTFIRLLKKPACLATFAAYLKDNYTSHTGFASHYPNSVETWRHRTGNFLLNPNAADTLANGTHSLGALMEFLLKENLQNPEAALLQYATYHKQE